MALFSAEEISEFCKRDRGRLLLEALDAAMEEAEQEWDWFDRNNGPNLIPVLRGLATIIAAEGRETATPEQLKETRLVYTRLTSQQYYAAMVARSFTRKLFEAMVAQVKS
jgi:hypothetical protein